MVHKNAFKIVYLSLIWVSNIIYNLPGDLRDTIHSPESVFSLNHLCVFVCVGTRAPESTKSQYGGEGLRESVSGLDIQIHF